MLLSEGIIIINKSRKVPQQTWQANPQGAEYLIDKPNYELTAIGYGADPTFAAFYPNCHSVFGFYDGEVVATIEDYTYEVIGWINDQNKDFIKTFIGAERDVNKVITAIKGQAPFF